MGSLHLEVTGLVCLNNFIYVSHDDAPTIYAISREEPFDRIQGEDIHLPDLSEKANFKRNVFAGTKILDLAACVTTRSLFSSQTDSFYSRSVWKIQFPDKSISKVFETEPKNPYRDRAGERPPEIYPPERPQPEEVMRLSTNDVGELLLLVNEHGRWYVYIHSSSDGIQLRRIIIRDMNIEPRHAVKNPGGNIFISYIVKAANAMFVGEMSLNGEIVRSYDFDSMESFQRTASSPPSDIYIAIGGTEGIFVSEFSNNRIFLLDSQLTKCRMFLPYSTTLDEKLVLRNQLHSPSRICYLSAEQCLLVGQCERIREPIRKPSYVFKSSKYVSIFDLRHRLVDSQT